MRVQKASIYALTTAFVLSVATVVGVARISQAQPAEAPSPTHNVPHASQLVNVKACDPRLNEMTSGGYVGYAPGYYPGAYGYRRGYYWGDVYGGSYYQAPVTTSSPELGIDYINLSHKTMTEIEFGLVVSGVLRAEVKDVGTFSPGVEIKHKFGISGNVFPIQSALPQCPPLRITFQDGTHWRNPALPPKNQQIYMHP